MSITHREAKEALQGAVIVGATKFAVVAAMNLYEKLVGDAYSESDVADLKKLKQYYVQHLKVENSPVQ